MPWLTDGLEDPRRHGLSPAEMCSQFRGQSIYKAAHTSPTNLDVVNESVRDPGGTTS
jgi:hypothetical protein